MTGANVAIPGVIDAVEIGRGGFGVVYRATETDLGRDVAVKILTGELDERTRTRFERERRAMGALSSHPNIITIFRSGVAEDGGLYLVMEYLPGGSLAEQIAASGPTGWQDTLRIGIELCGALESAHRAGVLHRDVKPGNIIMDDLGRAKLGDFGIARLDGSPETKSAVITASVAHAPPEVIAGDKPDERSDVYSLASTLFEVASGSPAFVRSTDESMIPMFARIVHDPTPDLRQQGVPDQLALVLEQAMAKQADQRFRSAGEFGRALGDCQRALGLPETRLWIAGEPQGHQSEELGQATRIVSPPPASGTDSLDVPVANQGPPSPVPPPSAPPSQATPSQIPPSQVPPSQAPSGQPPQPSQSFPPPQQNPQQQVPPQPAPPQQFPAGPNVPPTPQPIAQPAARQQPQPSPQQYQPPQQPASQQFQAPQPPTQQQGFAQGPGHQPQAAYAPPVNHGGGGLAPPPGQSFNTGPQSGGQGSGGSNKGLLVTLGVGGLALLIGFGAWAASRGGGEDPDTFAGSTSSQDDQGSDSSDSDSSSSIGESATPSLSSTTSTSTTTTTIAPPPATNPPRLEVLADLPTMPSIAEPYVDYRTMVEADGAFTFQVPSEWDEDLLITGQVIVTPDNNAALNDEAISGALVSGTQWLGAWDPDIFLEAVLAELSDPENPCSELLREPYVDGPFDGLIYAELCGAGRLLQVDVIVANEERNAVIFIGVQMVDERDFAAFEEILESFILLDPALLPPVS